MLVPVHQNPADLALTIVAGEIATPLTVLKQAALHIDPWKLTFHIIGESHLVRIERAGTPILCELLACVQVMADVQVHQHCFGDLAVHCYTQPGYSVTVDFDDCHDLAPGADDSSVLEVSFPETAGHIPVTRVEWTRAGEHAVRWRTLHMYPYKGSVMCVRSLSYFDVLQYNQTS